MNIHFYTLTSFPYGMASAKRIQCYAKGLIAAGNNVDVVISRKLFHEDAPMPAQGVYNGISYNYVCGVKKSNYYFKRGLDHYFLDLVIGFIYAIKNVNKGDIIYCYFYNNLFHLLLLIIGKYKKAKVVREVCEHPSALGHPTLTKRIARFFEFHCLFPLFDGFIPISKSLGNLVNQYKSRGAHYLIVPILVDDIDNHLDFSKIKSPYSVPYIIHTGTMLEQKDSISKILKGFSQFKKETKSNLKIVFTGPQANSNCKYIPLMEKLGIRDDVELLGMVSVDQVAILQHFAAFTIIYKSNNLQTRNCFPTKLGEMLINGTPVITTTVGDANLYLENNVNAFIISPDDQEALINCMTKLLTDANIASKIGKAGQDIAKSSFNPIVQGKRMSHFFSQL